MTDITLEQWARELLAAEYDRDGAPEYATIARKSNDALTIGALRAIEAALRLSAGADWVLVPREMAYPARATGRGAHHDYIKGWNDCRAAMLAAAPRHEPGEVES